MGVSPATIRVVNITDIATGVVYPTGQRRALLLQARGLAAAAGSLGVSITCAANLGKFATSASIAAAQTALVSNFNATSPSLASVTSAVASAAGVPLAKLVPAPPTAGSVAVAGPGAALVGATVITVPQDVSAILSQDAAIGFAIALAVILLASALYLYRSIVVHGKLPCFRDRRREQYELKAAAIAEVEARFNEDTTETTIKNPLASAGKGALTVRVPRAAAAEIARLREEAEEHARKIAELTGNQAAREEAAARAEQRAAAAAAQQRQQQQQQQEPAAATAVAFAPMRVGAAPMLPPPSLPPPALWVATVDPASGRTYYFNKETNETSWKKPAGL